MELRKQTKAENKNTLLIHIFAGHGVLSDGMQTLLVNEFDKRKKFYKQFPAERLVRFLAEKCPNTYNIAIFACCREFERPEYSYISLADARTKMDLILKEKMEKVAKDNDYVKFMEELKEVKTDTVAGRGNAFESDLKAANFLIVFGAS